MNIKCKNKPGFSYATHRSNTYSILYILIFQWKSSREYEKINEKEEENRKKDVARWIVVCVLNYSYNKGDLMFGESGNHGNIQKIGMWNICAESSAIEFPYP